jgi:hypothetical protein
VQGEGEDVAAVVVEVFAQTDELFLFGLSVPFYDASVLRAGVDVGVGYFEGGDAFCVAAVLHGIAESVCEEGALYVFEEFVLFSELNVIKVTCSCRSCSVTASSIYCMCLAYSFSTMKKSSSAASSSGRLSLLSAYLESWRFRSSGVCQADPLDDGLAEWEGAGWVRGWGLDPWRGLPIFLSLWVELVDRRGIVDVINIEICIIKHTNCQYLDIYANTGRIV